MSRTVAVRLIVSFTTFIAAIAVSSAADLWASRGRVTGESAPAKPRLPKHTRKLTGPVEVTLQFEGAPPSQIGETFQVRGEIRSKIDLNQVKVSWILDPSTDLVSGASEQTVNLVADQPQSFVITLRARAREIRNIQLRASSAVNGAQVTTASHLKSPQEPLALADKDKDQAAEPAADASTAGESLDAQKVQETKPKKIKIQQ